MSDRPIIFSAPMIRALLDGRKSMTRRVLKPQPLADGYYEGEIALDAAEGGAGTRFSATAVGGGAIRTEYRDLPYAVGDRLWVREAYISGFNLDEDDRPVGDLRLWYRADGFSGRWLDTDTYEWRDYPPWRSSIHMPRWASRLTLLVTAVKVERLQEISDGDCIAEGACDALPMTALGGSPREAFADLWNSIHGPGAWAANPWVAAVSFEVHRCNIDQMPEVA